MPMPIPVPVSLDLRKKYEERKSIKLILILPNFQ
jgi:hypothetical protein